MSAGVVDLRSDTVTRPTPAMREAMAGAEVGDDLLDRDPTTRRLEERVAELLGKERALFFPSGVMANQAALAVQAPRGTEVIVEADAHVFRWEMAAASVLSGLQVNPVPTPDGILTGSLVEEAIRSAGAYSHATALVCLENTHLGSGGRVLPPGRVAEVREVADRHGLPVHLDGARLWNAAAASGAEPAELAAPADSVMVSLSKGLGCPAGSLLAGSSQVVEEAVRVRRRFGGGMRQTGILAAAGLYALDHHRERLRADHANAGTLARAVAGMDGLSAVEPETNIVMLDVLDESISPGDLVNELATEGVRLVRFGGRRLRAVTHLDVDGEGIRRAVDILKSVLARG